MPRLIIGCGYLGRRVADKWRQTGDTVFALTRSDENAKEFQQAGLQPLRADVTDADALKAALSSLPVCQTVLYAVGFDRNSGKTMREVYVGGLRNVLQNIVGKTRRFLYISSTSVYGQSGGEWVDEFSPCEPLRENGRICLEAEQLVHHFYPPLQSDPETRSTKTNSIQATHGEQKALSASAESVGADESTSLPSSSACILRLAGLYGPGRLLRRLTAVRAGEPIAGNPSAWLNLIHVEDAVRAVLACEKYGQPGQTYLVADDTPLTRREYYETLASLLQAPVPVFQEDRSRGHGHPMEESSAGSAAKPSSEMPPATSLNKRCANRRLHEDLHLDLLYPSAKEGLQAVLSEQTPED